MIKYNKHHRKYQLRGNIIILDLNSVTIQLNNYQTFDGYNYLITHNIDRDGLISINNMNMNMDTSKIMNLSVLYGSLSDNGGGIVAQNNFNFSIYNCKNISLVAQLSGGICGSGCYNFYIDNSVNFGLINGGSAGGICGSGCHDFKITNCKNLTDISGNGATSQGGIVGSDSYDCINGHLYNNIYSASVGGIAGADCSNFNIMNCINNSNMIGQWNGGIVAQSCSDYNLYSCLNNGLIGDNCGGLIAYQSGPINIKQMKLIKCVNRGTIAGINSGGICASSFFVYTAQQNSNIKVLFYKCINYGNVISKTTSGGICASNCLNTSVTPVTPVTPITLNDYVYELKLVKCFSKHGSLIGSNCFYTNTLNTNPYPPRVLKFINCKKKHHNSFVTSFNTVNNVITYSTNHGHKTNLL